MSHPTFYRWALTCLPILAITFATACETTSPQAEYVPPTQGERPLPPAVDRKIAAGDILSIEVVGQEDLTVERRVEIGGYISYPYLNKVVVAGKTTAEVASDIEGNLRGRVLKKPIVAVSVKNYRLNTVLVYGAVVRQGAIELLREVPMDILQAISEANGFQPVANKDKIELTRGGKTYKYRFDELRRESDPSRKIILEPGDLIFVPETLL